MLQLLSRIKENEIEVEKWMKAISLATWRYYYFINLMGAFLITAAGQEKIKCCNKHQIKLLKFEKYI